MRGEGRLPAPEPTASLRAALSAVSLDPRKAGSGGRCFPLYRQPREAQSGAGLCPITRLKATGKNLLPTVRFQGFPVCTLHGLEKRTGGRRPRAEKRGSGVLQPGRGPASESRVSAKVSDRQAASRVQTPSVAAPNPPPASGVVGLAGSTCHTGGGVTGAPGGRRSAEACAPWDRDVSFCLGRASPHYSFQHVTHGLQGGWGWGAAALSQGHTLVSHFSLHAVTL